MAISPGGTPALATAGTGDVLSGLIGALLAKGMGPFEAASLGVLAHVRAGFAAAERHGADHVIAGDVIDALPADRDRFLERGQDGRRDHGSEPGDGDPRHARRGA